jgi:hypothetical protein
MAGMLTSRAGMSDPNFKSEETPPPQPPRPQPRSQLEQDEMYARQLAEHYSTQGGQQGQGGYGSRTQPGSAPRRQQTGLRPNDSNDDREHSFFDGTPICFFVEDLDTNCSRRPPRDSQEHRAGLLRDAEDGQQVDYQLQEEA